MAAGGQDGGRIRTSRTSAEGLINGELQLFSLTVSLIEPVMSLLLSTGLKVKLSVLTDIRCLSSPRTCTVGTLRLLYKT